MSFTPFLDPTIPRPAPRLPIVPSNFNYSKPSPLISEPSLIFDYHNLKNSSPAYNTSNLRDTCADANPTKQPEDPTLILMEFMSKVEHTLNQLQSQIDSISSAQENQNNVLDHIVQLLSSQKRPVTSEQGIQTDESFTSTTQTDQHASSSENKLVTTPTEKARSRNNSGNSVKSSSSSSSKSGRKDADPSAQDKVIATRVKKPLPLPSVTETASGYGDNEDLSMVLKDLKLPTVQENSMYSEASLRTMDLEDFDSSEDESEDENQSFPYQEVVKPTTTFYRNVLGNVNKLLDPNDREAAVHGSETTIYGMSSTNLSFATRQYLQKYGLTKDTGNKHVQRLGIQKRWNQDGQADTLEPKDRMIDVSALKNQPKLL